ncbi:hypothetical protein DC498_11575 [Terrimonas sp.]|uniref:ABC transporter ATP-binding protein n=1 Tax=Terrimonas sp. TaxID=1914338 RepID=UPI000D523CA3|nr:ABC transporter ATP-binding protein [Terrimonas sp.]PVD52022.1 hypothetical protein DC498_11575 [Terrimonas sp.]
MIIKRKREFLLAIAIRLILKVLPRKFKIKAALNLFYIFLNSVIELIGIAFLIPLLIIILDEEKIRTNIWLHKLYTVLNFDSNGQFIIFLSLMVLLITLCKNIVSIYLIKLQYNFSFSLYKFISLSLLQQYYDLGLQQLKTHNSNRIVNHITSVTLMFSQNVVSSVSGIINESFVFILFAVGLFVYDPSVILLITFTIMPFVLIFLKLIRNKIQNIGKEKNRIAVEQSKLLYETFQGYVDIEIRNKKNWVFRRFLSLLQNMSIVQIRNAVYLQLPLKFIEVVIVLALVSIVCFGIWMNKSIESVGVLLGVIAVAAYRLLPGINRLMNFSMTLRNHVYTFSVIEKVIPVKNKKVFQHAKEAASQTIKFNQKIQISNISFSFDGKIPILNNVDFTIQKGEIIGLIGGSGSGKTTLLNILLRFYKETSGTICVDDKKLDDVDVTSWRQLIGYVPQDVFIFDGSLKENIALGDSMENIDEGLLLEVIDRANLSSVVKTWEKGVDTNLGERGGKLSGGQKQRLGIARALYKGAEILFFDEATSALDIQTEEEINNSIKELSEANNQLTIVIIAHRYTSLKHCTKIIELNQGNVVKEWTYNELIEKRIFT